MKDKTAVLSVNVFFYDTNRKRLIRLYDGLVFGRSEGNEHFPDDREMSREHVRVVMIGTDVFIEDLHSSNRTRVNKGPLMPGKPNLLKFNDVIEFGGQKMIFTANPDFGAEEERVVAASQPASQRRVERPAPSRASRLFFAFTRGEDWDWPTRIWAAAMLLFLLAAFGAIADVLHEGLAHSPVWLGIRYGFAFLVAGGASTFVCYAVSAKALEGLAPLKPFAFIPALLTQVALILACQRVLGYPSDVVDNELALKCAAHYNSDECPHLARSHASALSRLPKPIQDEIALHLRDGALK